MKKLEDFISGHRAQFEDIIPDKQHEQKFIALLDERKRNLQSNRFSSVNNTLKVAATVIALIGLGAGIIAILRQPLNEHRNAESRLPAELVEMELYYASFTQEKIDRIETLAGSGPEAEMVKELVEGEIRTLNKTTETLKNEYINGTKDERLVNAIKNNYRILGNLLDKVVKQLSDPESRSSELIRQSNNNLKSHEITNA